MTKQIITGQAVYDEVASYFPATLTEDERGRLVTALDGIPVSILGITRDECGDLSSAEACVATGTPDDWLTGAFDLSEDATMDPDAQMCDLLAAHDRAVAQALTDEADETLRAMAGDWVHEVGVVVRASQNDECLMDFEGRRGFEIRAVLCSDELEPDGWRDSNRDDTDGRLLTADRAAEIAAQALGLESRILDAWAEESMTDDGVAENDLSVWQDLTWDGRPITWISATAEDADDYWPSVGVTVDLRDDECAIASTVWAGLAPRNEFDATAMSPRQALVEALEQLLDRDLPETHPGDGLLARWSREVAAQDE